MKFAQYVREGQSAWKRSWAMFNTTRGINEMEYIEKDILNEANGEKYLKTSNDRKENNLCSWYAQY